MLDFGAIRHELEVLYSHTGRPSVDPELMIRMLLIGYLYGIRSERRLVDEVHLNLAYRWFCRLGLEGRVPDRSTFSKNRHGRFAEGDTGPFLAWLLKREIAPHVPVLDRQHQTDGKYDLSHFAYDADRDSFTCLEGHEMRLRKVDPTMRIRRYSADTETCGACPIRKACTTAPARTVTRHMDEAARQIARDLSRTEKFTVSRRKRKKVEMLFAHLKRNLGFTRPRLRGLRGAEDEFLLAATAQNLKRLAKLVPA